MHEITLCQRALEIIEQQAQLHGAQRITGVWLEVGAFSCVESSAMEFCFELVCRDTIAEGCQLHLSQQDAECWCPECQDYVTLLSSKVKRCPRCQCDRLRISGDESLQIKRLEIEQETQHV
ncbi:protein HypA [Salmonella enterica subsp. enterica serovar Choleraesuis]|nr:protein HypA [Salmonella enterica subsp. enterica serovar Choleraesuis]